MLKRSLSHLPSLQMKGFTMDQNKLSKRAGQLIGAVLVVALMTAVFLLVFAGLRALWYWVF